MFRRVVDECFDYMKEYEPSKAKYYFGYIWSVFAGKTVKFNDGEISLSWREISAKLAVIYNEWFNCSFTTDAFLNVQSSALKIGDSEAFDTVFMDVYRHNDCTGIFYTKTATTLTADAIIDLFSEINILTAEEHFYQQGYDKGHCVGDPKRISADQYEKLCFSMGK